MIEYRKLIAALQSGEVEFVVVGGVAMIAQGSARVTQDVDIVYAREPDNLERLVKALMPFHPRLRGPGDTEMVKFLFDSKTLRAGMNFTLTTDAGSIDLLGEIAGIGGYREAVALSETGELLGKPTQILSLAGLVRAKRAAGRPRDIDSIHELEALLEARRHAAESQVKGKDA